METKTMSQQPTLLPSFGYFAEVGGGSAAAAWQNFGMVGGTGQLEVPSSPSPQPSLDFDKDTLGQYIHKIYCRDCCRVAEERQQVRHVGDSETGRRGCSSGIGGVAGGGAGVTLVSAGAMLSPRSWDQHQPDDVQEQQEQGAASAAAGALLLQQSLFPIDGAAASFFSDLDKERNKESLKRKLLLRRSAGELPMDQEKHSPLKSPPSFAQQKKHLQRAQTADSRARTSHGQGVPEWICDMDSDPHPEVLRDEAKPQKRPRVAVGGGEADGKGSQQLRRTTTQATTAMASCASSRDRMFGKVTSRLGSGCSRTGHNVTDCTIQLKSVDELLEADQRSKGGCSSSDTGRVHLSNDKRSSADNCSDGPSAGGRSDQSSSSRQKETLCSSVATDKSGVDAGYMGEEQPSSGSQVAGSSPPTRCSSSACGSGECRHCASQLKAVAGATSSTTAAPLAFGGATAAAAASTTASGQTGCAASSSAVVAPTRSPTKSSMSSSPASANKSLQTNRTSSGGTTSGSGGCGSKKTKPKAHTKTKVIKFHEYKGPPAQPVASSAASSSSSSAAQASKATFGQGGSSRDSQRAPAVTVGPMVAATSPLPVVAPGECATAAAAAAGNSVGAQTAVTNQQPGVVSTSAPTVSTDVECGSSGSSTELAQYNLMLRQQQLFLQWQLELQQKSMPVLMPMVQTPSPPPQQPPAVTQRLAVGGSSSSNPPATHTPMALEVAGQFRFEAPPLHQTLLVESLEGLEPEPAAPDQPAMALACGGSAGSSSSYGGGGSGSSPLPALSPQIRQHHEQQSPAAAAAATTTTSAATASDFQTMHDSRGLPCTAGTAAVAGLCMSASRVQHQQPSPQLISQPQRKDGQGRMTLPSLEDMKIVELKAELKQRGLPVSGSKQQLIKRLQSHQHDSRSVSGDSISRMTPHSAVGGNASSPLSAPSSSLASPPSTPVTLSSQSEDGYLHMLSASVSSSISSGSSSSSSAAAEEEERMFHGAGAAIFLPSPAAVHEEIVRQQQRQIEELQKLLRESQKQLSTQQLQASTAIAGAGVRKDRKSPKKAPSGRVTAAAATMAPTTAATTGTTAQPRTAERQKLQHQQVANNTSSSDTALAIDGSHSAYMPLLSAMTTTNSQQAQASTMDQQQPHAHTLHVAATFAGGKMQAALMPVATQMTLAVSQCHTSPIGTADTRTLSHLSLPLGITALHDHTDMLDKAADGSIMKDTDAASRQTMALHCGTINEDSTSCDLELNMRGQDEASSSATTMDDVLEMLIAASPDLMAGIADGKEENAATDRRPMILPDHTSQAEMSSVHTYLMEPVQTSALQSGESGLHKDQRGDASLLAEQHSHDEFVAAPASTHQCLSPGSADWSHIVEGTGLNLDNEVSNTDSEPPAPCQFGSNAGCQESRQAASVHLHETEEDVASLALDDLESNLATLEFKDEGSSSGSGTGCSSGSGALDWLDIMMQSNISMATPGLAMLPHGFQGDPLLTSHPANVADLFTMDDADFGMLSDFGCSISWEKLQEVTTA